jgi:hypothetical protein
VSTTIKSSSGAGEDVGRGYGLISFAFIMLNVIAFMNLIYGIAAVSQSHVFVAHAHYVVGDLRAWGWVTIIVAVVQFFVALGVLAGSQVARWLAVAVVGLNALNQMLFLPAYPAWSLVVIALDVVALYGLCAYGSRQNLAP